MHIYINGGGKCRRVSEAFSAGSGFGVTQAANGLQPGPVACYGMLRGLRAILDAAIANGREWFYLDNGYWQREVLFRVTRNALQWQGQTATRKGFARMREAQLPWQPWRLNGEHVLIAQQTSAWYELVGEGSREVWTASVKGALRAHTDRPIRVRPKGSDKPLSHDLSRCWAVVTHSSNVAVDALIAGVPVFALGQSAAQALALNDLTRIENPIRGGDREYWAAMLAGNQWTLDEMRDGTCWRDLQDQHEKTL